MIGVHQRLTYLFPWGVHPPACYRPRLPQRCDETSGLIAATVGTSAAARVVLPMEGKGSRGRATSAPESATATATATESSATSADDGAPYRVPMGLWCYRLDRRRVVLGGALTDGGSVFEWLRGALALSPGEDADAVMREVEAMRPASHGLVVRR